jgi:hypothetical protein
MSKMAAEHRRVNALPPWLLLASGDCIGPTISRGGRRVVAGYGTNGLLTVGLSSRVGGNCSSVSLEMRGATTAGPLCAAEQRAGLEEDWWTWEPAQ